MEEDKNIITTVNNKIYFRPSSALSNFYPSDITIDEKLYYHVQGYYHSCKHKGSDDEFAEYIRKFKDPSVCKIVGKSIGIIKIKQEEWESGYKIEVMKVALLAKFSQHENLAKILLDTGSAELIEYAPWNEYWGSGRDLEGNNMLGKLLMEIRDTLK